jgi:hypothetical protein
MVITEDNETSDAMTAYDGSSNANNKIVLHEDKKYYPDSDEVYPGK